MSTKKGIAMPDTDAFTHESKRLSGLRTALLDERRVLDLDTHIAGSRTRALLGDLSEQAVADGKPIVLMSQAQASL